MPDAAGALDGAAGGRSALAARCLAFNLAPVDYVHPSWYAAVETGAFLEGSAKVPSFRAAVSEALLDRFGLSRLFALDFAAPRARVVLLDREVLESLLLYVGAALRNTELRSVLDGRRVGYLRREIGPGAYDFATKRVRLLGPLPDFAYGAGEAAGRVRDSLIRTGAAYTLSVRALEDPAYRQRVALILPREESTRLMEDLPVAGVPEGDGLPPLVRRILKEFGPRWLPFFD